MHRHDNPVRSGWLRYALLALLAAAGGAGGLYLSGVWSRNTPSRPADSTGVEAAPAVQRFPLTAGDVRDGQGAPSLAADSAGRVYLAWASQTGDEERTLFLSRFDPGEEKRQPFGPPVAVTRSSIFQSVSTSRGQTITRDVKMMPHVAVAGDRVYLAWTETLPNHSGVRLVLATSVDAGSTFGPARCVHRSDKGRPTFTALAISPESTLACSWLDNRTKAQLPFAAVRPAGQEDFAEERMVHAGQDGKGVCPCCPTAACFGTDGTLYVAFRNVQDGYRDIAIGRLLPGQSAFEGPFPVLANNTWKFDGCPHDGPSLAVVGDALTVAWMDARTGSQRCYFARAKLADLQFASRELHPSAAGNQGNPKLCADSAGGLHAVWEESLGAEPADPPAGHRHGASADPRARAGGKAAAGRAIWYAHLAPGQADFGMARSVAPKPGAFQTRPAIVRLPSGDVVAAWNELDAKGKAIVVSPLVGKQAAQGDRP